MDVILILCSASVLLIPKDLAQHYHQTTYPQARISRLVDASIN
jgi:hypothetical protein